MEELSASSRQHGCEDKFFVPVLVWACGDPQGWVHMGKGVGEKGTSQKRKTGVDAYFCFLSIRIPPRHTRRGQASVFQLHVDWLLRRRRQQQPSGLLLQHPFILLF